MNKTALEIEQDSAEQRARNYVRSYWRGVGRQRTVDWVREMMLRALVCEMERQPDGKVDEIAGREEIESIIDRITSTGR